MSFIASRNRNRTPVAKRDMLAPHGCGQCRRPDPSRGPHPTPSGNAERFRSACTEKRRSRQCGADPAVVSGIPGVQCLHLSQRQPALVGRSWRWLLVTARGFWFGLLQMVPRPVWAKRSEGRFIKALMFYGRPHPPRGRIAGAAFKPTPECDCPAIASRQSAISTTSDFALFPRLRAVVGLLHNLNLTSRICCKRSEEVRAADQGVRPSVRVGWGKCWSLRPFGWALVRIHGRLCRQVQGFGRWHAAAADYHFPR